MSHNKKKRAIKKQKKNRTDPNQLYEKKFQVKCRNFHNGIENKKI